MSFLDQYSEVSMPAEVPVEEIAEEAMQAGFAVIAARLEGCGYPVSGDVTPWESVALDKAFSSYVRMMALNNDVIAEINDHA